MRRRRIPGWNCGRYQAGMLNRIMDRCGSRGGCSQRSAGSSRCGRSPCKNQTLRDAIDWQAHGNRVCCPSRYGDDLKIPSDKNHEQGRKNLSVSTPPGGDEGEMVQRVFDSNWIDGSEGLSRSPPMDELVSRVTCPCLIWRSQNTPPDLSGGLRFFLTIG